MQSGLEHVDLEFCELRIRSIEQEMEVDLFRQTLNFRGHVLITSMRARSRPWVSIESFSEQKWKVHVLWKNADLYEETGDLFV